jgi:hypothetical protein
MKTRRSGVIVAMRIAIAVITLAFSAAPASASVRAGDRWLVINCACNVGGGGTPESRDWYVQLGVFTDRDRADAFEEAAIARGLVAATFGAGWINRGDSLAHGPWVVVSRPYPTPAAARRARARYRTLAGDAIVRQFLTCPDEAD